jgi:hypothetical protein
MKINSIFNNVSKVSLESMLPTTINEKIEALISHSKINATVSASKGGIVI